MKSVQGLCRATHKSLQVLFLFLIALACVTVLYKMNNYNNSIWTAKSSSSNFVVSDKYPHIDTLHSTPVDKLWTYVTSNTFARRSAHYDDRKQLFKQPVLLAFVFRDGALETGPLPDIYAKVVYSDGTEKCLSHKASWKVRSKPKNKNKPHLGYGYVLTILLPSAERPECLFLSLHKDCSSHSSYISIFWHKPETQLEFAVCLHQPLFLISDHEYVAAWMEMNRALGAQRITLYYQEEVSYQVRHTIQKYIDEGFVVAISWLQNSTIENDSNFGQVIMSMDCLYRNMHVAKYIAFHDLDELLIPHRSTTWHGFVKELDQPKRSCFQFCMAYFHDVDEVMTIGNLSKTESGCKNVSNIPVMFKRTERTAKVSCRLFRWKNICKPSAVRIVKIHLAEPAPGYNKPTVVSPSMGMIHHYRVNDKRSGEESIQDLTVMKYMGQVMENLLARFCHGY